jgi:large subunit ribosomal protein L9
MKVILKQDLKGTGKKDQIIEVSDGYARNFLFPRKMAVEASAQNLNSIRTAEAAKQHKKDTERDVAVDLAEKIKQMTVKVSVKAGEKGRLFGSVTTQEIADALKAQHGVDIDKRKISLEEPIKQVGAAKAVVKLYPEVSTTLSLEVVAQ